MTLIVVAHLTKENRILRPLDELTASPFDYVVQTGCCDHARSTLATVLTMQRAHRVDLTPLCPGWCMKTRFQSSEAKSFAYTRALRAWKERYQPRRGLVVASAEMVQAILTGMSTELQCCAINPGDTLLIEPTRNGQMITFPG